MGVLCYIFLLLTRWPASLAPDVKEMGKTNKIYATMYIKKMYLTFISLYKRMLHQNEC